MGGSFHHYEPSDGHGLPHDPFNAIIGPRPIGWISSIDTVAPEVDEFALAGLTPAQSRRIKPPRVAESPVSMECRLIEIVQLHTADRRPIDSWLVLGEVVAVYIDKALLKDGVYMTAEALPILRAGGPGGYAQITPGAMFDMRRPR